MQRLVRGGDRRVRPAVDDDRRLARRRRNAANIALAARGNESPDHLDAKIDRHDGPTFVVIEKVFSVAKKRHGTATRGSVS